MTFDSYSGAGSTVVGRGSWVVFCSRRGLCSRNPCDSLLQGRGRGIFSGALARPDRGFRTGHRVLLPT
jgi:hypothetical protein